MSGPVSTMHGLRPSRFDLVLVVAADADTRASLVELMQEEGYGVLSVERLHDALAFLETAHASIVLIDARDDAREIGTLLSSMTERRATPALVLTDDATPPHSLAGATIVRRPWDPEDLAYVVATMLRRDRSPSLRPSPRR